jgi:hypothetical protein
MSKANLKWQWVEPRGGWQKLPSQGEHEVGRDIKERIRNMTHGQLGFCFQDPATPEEAKVLRESGFMHGGMFEGRDLWFVNPKHGALETKGESSMENEIPSVSAPLLAAARQGAKELAQILPAFPESVRVVEEPGAMGNPTPQMITEQIEGERSYEDKLNSYANSAPEREPEREDVEER